MLGDFRAALKKTSSDIKSALPRFVLLGPPGSGKTTAVQYLAWQVAGRGWKVAGQSPIPVRVRLREWEAWTSKLVVAAASLPEYLAWRYREVQRAPDAATWRRWLRRGDIFLLLDGLDELPDNDTFSAMVTETLSTYALCPTLLTCRTVSFEQHRTVCPDFPVFALSGLEDGQRDAYIRAYPARYPNKYDAEGLIDHLRRIRTMHPLAANPLLLSILCFVVDSPDPAAGVELPATRAELYERVVERLLARRQRVHVQYPTAHGTLALADKRSILEQAALSLFAAMGEQRRLEFDEATLLEALTWAAKTEERAHPRDLANSLLLDVVHNSGLLRGQPGASYAFLHLTLLEFLAAAGIARQVNRTGWQAQVRVEGWMGSVWDLVDHKAWDPRWQEVITLLAGQLDAPGPLLALLRDEKEKKDDLFQHRLAAAALCMPEISQQRWEDCSEHFQAITTAAFGRWWRERRNRTEQAVPHLRRALPALVQVNAPADGVPLLARLAGLLQDKNGQVRSRAAAAVGALGSAAATPEFLARLAGLLQDENEDVRSRAAAAVGTLSEAGIRAFRGGDSGLPFWQPGIWTVDTVEKLSELPKNDEDKHRRSLSRPGRP